MHSFGDQEIWNEFQWEAHLNEMEEKSEQLRRYIETSLGEENPRWTRFLNGFATKLEAIDAYIEDELMFEDAYFPDDEDDWEDDDDEMDDFFMSSEDDMIDDDSEFGDGDEWKLGLPEYQLHNDNETEWPAEALFNENGEPENIRLYDESRELAADMLKLAELVSPAEQDEKFLSLVTETVNLSTKVAGAFAFGFEPDVLGGNIAYCKRALQSANTVLDMLIELKHRDFMRFVDYDSLHERMFDLRNDIGIHIQDLREELDQVCGYGNDSTAF